MADTPESNFKLRPRPANAALWSGLAMGSVVALMLVLPMQSTPVAAQGTTTPDQADSGRFSLAPVDGGVLRLDRETGEMTLCTSRDSKLTCEPVNAGKAATAPAGAPGAQSDALTSLRRENEELRERIRSLEEMVEAVPGADGGPPPPAPVDPSLQVPSEEDIDRALDTVERVLKKFRERIRRFNEPLPDSSPAPGDGQAGPPAKPL